jgi:hypothetical protein
MADRQAAAASCVPPVILRQALSIGVADRLRFGRAVDDGEADAGVPSQERARNIGIDGPAAGQDSIG